MEQLLGILKPEIITAMLGAPIVLQLLRGLASRFGIADTANAAAVLNAVAVFGTVWWVGWGLRLPVPEIALQSFVAWILSDKWFTHGILPLAKGPNPLMPDA